MIIFVIILFSTLFIVCPCYPYANKLAEHQCLQKCGILEPEIEETESHSSAGMDETDHRVSCLGKKACKCHKSNHEVKYFGVILGNMEAD
jgi:hypothetical protein